MSGMMAAGCRYDGSRMSERWRPHLDVGNDGGWMSGMMADGYRSKCPADYRPPKKKFAESPRNRQRSPTSARFLSRHRTACRPTWSGQQGSHI